MSEWKSRSAYMFVKAAPNDVESLWARFKAWEHTIGSWVVTGEFDLLVWYDVPSAEAMQARVAEVRAWPGVQHTASQFVHQGYKNGAWWWEKPAGVWMQARETGPMCFWQIAPSRLMTREVGSPQSGPWAFSKSSLARNTG